MKKSITKAVLETVAAELSRLIDLDPAIPTGKKVKKDRLIADIIETAQELMPGDTVTGETGEVMTALGVQLPESEETPPSDPPKPIPPPPKKYTRMAAVTDALKAARKPLDRDTWIERADKLYTSHGGRSNLNETKWSLNYVIGVLTGLDITIETDKGFQLR